MSAEQHDVLHSGEHQKAEARKFNRLQSEMSDESDTSPGDAQDEWPTIVVVPYRRAQDEKVGDQRHGDDALVETFAAEKTQTRPGEQPPEDAQARGAERALEHR